MAPPKPELSKAEWVVMNTCWNLGKATARQVFEAIANAHWDYQTVKTMLDRITEKGYLKRDKLGPLCLFEPIEPRKKAVKRAIDGFLETVLGNTIAPIFAHLAQDQKLSEEDIAALKKLIDEHEENA